MSTPGLACHPGERDGSGCTRRLETARRGAGLLDRKLRILQGELDPARGSAAQAAARWESCQADADRWLLRASLLSGQRAIRLAGDPPARGRDRQLCHHDGDPLSGPGRVRHPGRCDLGRPGPGRGPAGASRRARGGCPARGRRAALRIMEAETAVTRYRLRAVRDRWIPRLEQALAEVTFEIEELERADAARLRLATSALTGAAAGRAHPGRGPQA